MENKFKPVHLCLVALKMKYNCRHEIIGMEASWNVMFTKTQNPDHRNQKDF